MRYRRSSQKKKESQVKRFRTNREIRVPEVMLLPLDGGKPELTPTATALAQAEETGLDLVEIDPTANPPVCKVIDNGKYIYEQQKKLKKQKSQNKVQTTKGLRLTYRMADHDFEVRRTQGLKFLEKGHKVKIELQLRGREREYAELGIKMIERMVEALTEETEATLEGKIDKQGGRFSATVTPAKK